MIPQYSFTWNSFKNTISNGFARFQQNGEFVDMSIVVEDHIVKVHQNIMAVASPYFKQILQSVPSQHPIVFLCNVTHEIFAYILEYIYTGEVKVPSEKLSLFIEATKILHVFGVNNIIPPKHSFPFKQDELRKESNIHLFDRQTIQSNNNSSHSVTINATNGKKESLNSGVVPLTSSHITQSWNENQLIDQTIQSVNNSSHSVTTDRCNSKKKSFNVALPEMPQTSSHFTQSWNEDQLLKNINITPIMNTENNHILNLVTDLIDNADINEMDYSTNTKDNIETMISNEPIDAIVDNCNDVQEMSSLNDNLNMNINTDNNLCKNEPVKDLNMTISTNYGSEGPKYSIKVSVRNPTDTPSPQYTMSNRGSLQMIFNRYLYYVHHTSHGGRRRRWRCIDYRHLRCPAIIDTDDESITFRRFTHTHHYHDDKIFKKLNKKTIYSTITNILNSEKIKAGQRDSNESD